METLVHIVARANPNGDCTKNTCPATDSVYGYAPNLVANIVFLIFFALSAALYAFQGYRTKTYFFSIAMVIGGVSEVLGYVAKLILHDNPFSQTGFEMSVVLLTFAPAFYAAGIYYTLKHICLTFGSSFSRLRPALYTYIFISCDLFSIVLQALGGAIASVGSTMSLVDAGTHIMIAGLSSQVLTLLVFGVLAAEYGVAVYRNRAKLNPATAELRSTMKFKLFIAALWVAYVGILIRCVYRVAELQGGWGSQNVIMQNQYLFIGLDSVPVSIAALMLNVWHPGWCFPKQHQNVAYNEGKLASGSSSEDESKV